MIDPVKVLLCWEPFEANSWNPELAELLRRHGFEVTEARDVSTVQTLDLARFHICLPRFRVCAAHMSCLDEVLVRSGIRMLNSRQARERCEHKALAHLAFAERGIKQPKSCTVSAEGVIDRELAWSGETIVKPLFGSRGSGIEILPSFAQGLERAKEREEDVLVQQMIWPARCWRVIVGRESGIVDPYWRRPPRDADRVLSISTGSTIVRDPCPARVERVAREMLTAVDGDLLAVDILETATDAYALEINHNFDAHGGSEPAAAAFEHEIQARLALPVG
jgi:glutathione synthase/RimK-type ligase-like ATP-grasp enzyme